MYARLVTGSMPPNRLDKAVKPWLDSVKPSVKQQKGFISVRLLFNRRDGEIASMGLWEAEADLQGSVQWNREKLSEFAGMFSTGPIVKNYEVVAEV